MFKPAGLIVTATEHLNSFASKHLLQLRSCNGYDFTTSPRHRVHDFNFVILGIACPATLSKEESLSVKIPTRKHRDRSVGILSFIQEFRNRTRLLPKVELRLLLV